LGVDIFRERQLKNMKLTDFALGSKKVIHALELIYRRLFGKRLWVERMDDEGSADDCWSTGVYIPEDLSEQFEGWYGFEGKKQAGQPIPRSGCAVVYFYCHDSPKKESDLKTRLKKKGFKTEKVDSWDKATLRNVVVRNYEGEKELSWFESVYKAVGAIK